MKTIEETIAGVAVTYVIGQTQNENHAAIDRGAPDDVWFHAANQSSCHVILQFPIGISLDKKQTRLARTRGAALCKQHTNRLASQKHVEIAYARVRDVEKTGIPGEVVVSPTNTKSIFI